VVKLNLLPAKVRAAELLRLAVMGGVIFYLLLAGVFAWRYAVGVAAVHEVEAKIKKVEEELRPLQVINDEVKKLTAEKTEQEAKKSKLAELTRRQAYLVRVMDLLPDLLQGGKVWLTELDQLAAKGTERRVLIEGRAHSIEAWADFYANLESQNTLGDLKIEVATSAERVNQRTVYKFKVSFVLKDPA